MFRFYVRTKRLSGIFVLGGGFGGAGTEKRSGDVLRWSSTQSPTLFLHCRVEETRLIIIIRGLRPTRMRRLFGKTTTGCAVVTTRRVYSGTKRVRNKTFLLRSPPIPFSFGKID